MNLENDREFQRFKLAVERELLPKLQQTGLVVSIVPTGPDKVDVKFAVELGLSIMLDKPIVAVVGPGTKIPEKLARVVDRFVELDFTDPNCGERIQEVVSEMIAEQGEPS